MLFDEVDDFFVSSAKERDFDPGYSPNSFMPANPKNSRDLDDLVPGSPFSLGEGVGAEAGLEMLPLLGLSPPLKPVHAPPLGLGQQRNELEFMVPQAASPPPFSPSTVLGCPVEIYPTPTLFVKSSCPPALVNTPSSCLSLPTSQFLSGSSQSSNASTSSAHAGFPVIPVIPAIPFSGLAFMEHCVPSESPQNSPAKSIATPPPKLPTTTTPSSTDDVASTGFVNSDPAIMAQMMSNNSSGYSSSQDEEDDDGRINSKTRKRRAPALANVPDHELNPDQLAKRMRRRQRNKESAQQSRQRKKQFMDELSDKVDGLTEENTALRLQIRDVVAENELLKCTLHHHQIPIPRLPRAYFTPNEQQAP